MIKLGLSIEDESPEEMATDKAPEDLPPLEDDAAQGSKMEEVD